MGPKGELFEENGAGKLRNRKKNCNKKDDGEFFCLQTYFIPIYS